MGKAVRTLRDWLADIVGWGERISSYVENMDEAAFLADPLTQDAVIRCMECIGEAARNVLADTPSAALSDLELVEAYWTRNRFAHGYYDLNMSRVWEAATVSVPQLVTGTKRVLETLE